MKDIKDYLHLYLGCDVMVTPPESVSYKCRLTGVMSKRTDGEDKFRIQVFEEDGKDGYEGHGIKWFDEDEVELILRPPEGLDLFSIQLASLSPEPFRWLLTECFDLFGLIDAGLAIDKTKLTCNEEVK